VLNGRGGSGGLDGLDCEPQGWLWLHGPKGHVDNTKLFLKATITRCI